MPQHILDPPDRDARSVAPPSPASQRGFCMPKSRANSDPNGSDRSDPACPFQSADWDALMPRGIYARLGRPVFNAILLIASLPFACIPIALIFVMLFITFRSLRQAGLIILNIPFAMIGGVVSLYLSGLYLSVPASVGFITLFGVAVLNGVVMVTYFNQLREAGRTLLQAVQEGAERRLRPVLMTALIASLGLVPLLTATGPGSELQRPLAVVVIGGLFTSTLLTLVLLPTLYAWIEGRAQRRLAQPTTEDHA